MFKVLAKHLGDRLHPAEVHHAEGAEALAASGMEIPLDVEEGVGEVAQGDRPQVSHRAIRRPLDAPSEWRNGRN